MLLQEFRNKLKLISLSLVVAGTFAGCSFVGEDLPECPSGLQIGFEYTYNMINADAFAQEVKSVNVWAFDQSGKFVWAGSASGSELETPGFRLMTPLPAGTYDFVAWCGLMDNDDFNLETYEPESKQELEVKLKTVNTDGINVSSSKLKGLYHGMRSKVVYSIDPYTPSVKTVTIPLTKDTNNITVMLQNLDGTPLESKDFSVSIIYADSWLKWDNAVNPSSLSVNYTPWSVTLGQTSGYKPETVAARSTITGVSTLLFESSTSRLIAGGDAILSVVRNTDQVEIIHIPLIEYFLLEKGALFDYMSDQEYLDRRDLYSILFFLDSKYNWYQAHEIYINGWAVVPPQNDTL